MITLENVTKVYNLGKAGPVTAVRGASLEIENGTVHEARNEPAR